MREPLFSMLLGCHPYIYRLHKLVQSTMRLTHLNILINLLTTTEQKRAIRKPLQSSDTKFMYSILLSSLFYIIKINFVIL